MSILIDKDTKVIVQGLGSTGRFHTDTALAYGTQMVAAVHPTKAGTTELFEGETDHSGVPDRADSYRVELPIFASVAEGKDATGLPDSPAFAVTVARSPAAIITSGLLVLVQLVMAAITTSPWSAAATPPSRRRRSSPGSPAR